MSTEEEYRAHPNYNYSALAALASGPKNYKYRRDHKIEGKALDNGTAVEILLNKTQNFEDLFVVPSSKKPSAQLGEYLDLYHKFEDHEVAYAILKEDNGGKLKSSPEKFIERFEEEAKEYYHFLKEAETKKVISLEDYQNIERAVNTLKTNKWTSQFFDCTDENIEVKYQVPVFFELEGFKYKILIDIVYINHYEKSVHIYDLKTTSKGVYSFQKSFMEYRYYLQNSLYSEGLKALKISLGLEGYVGMPMKFIVQEIEGWNQPVIFNYRKWHGFGRDGGYFKGDRYKGFLELSQELKWHTENDLWEYPMDIYLNEGERIVEYGGGTEQVQ